MSITTIDPSGTEVIEITQSDDDCIRMWLRDKPSVHTRRAYETDINHMLAFVQKPLATITHPDLQDYADSLRNASLALQARRISSVKSLFKLAFQSGKARADVAATLPIPVVRDTLSERILEQGDVQHMIRSEPKPRNRAILTVLYQEGLRIAEVASLTWRDLAQREVGGQLTVIGKGRRQRELIVPQRLYDALITLRPLVFEASDPIFRSQKGGAMDESAIHRVVKSAAQRVGLSDAVSAHWLRHSHVSHALDAGAPVHVVSKSAGHASLNTTTRYTHVRPGDGSANYITV